MVKDNKSDDDSEELQYSCLNETVRRQYFRYLAKQLEENVRAWCSNKEQCLKVMPCVQDCAELLEEKAIKSSVATQLYQRSMIKIIAEVRRLTSESCLEENLLKLQSSELPKRSRNQHITCVSQATQTENFLNGDNCANDCNAEVRAPSRLPPTLDERVELMQQMQVFSKSHCRKRKHLRQTDHINDESSDSSIVSQDVKPNVSEEMQQPASSVTCTENCDDEVARELAQLFSEEHSELDALFGISVHEEPDDPQISSILKEIERAPVPHLIGDVPAIRTKIQLPPDTNSKDSSHENTPPSKLQLAVAMVPNKMVQNTAIIELRHSLWPCELYMQRRVLTDCLNRHDDIRWAEAIRVRFDELFGEDSDDEFAINSPSTELDEVLIGSCIRRITPWLVKHLMRPLQCNLIANRYLFKQLAKHLARNIILNNQYPAERDIKYAVEQYFCLHQAVRTMADIY